MTRKATVYFQITMVVLAAMNQYEAIFPPSVSKFVPFALLVVSGVQAIIAHGYAPTGEKIERGEYIAPRNLPDEDKK